MNQNESIRTTHRHAPVYMGMTQQSRSVRPNFLPHECRVITNYRLIANSAEFCREGNTPDLLMAGYCAELSPAL